MSEQPATAHEPPSRAGYVISQLYYYIAAVVGVGLLLGGGIVAFLGVRTAVFPVPREFETAREGVRQLLHGLAVAGPGVLVLWWHLREARKREGTSTASVFWGRSLYFHLVSLVALAFVLVGVIRALQTTVDLALPHCFSAEGQILQAKEPSDGELVLVQESGSLSDECFPAGKEAARAILDSGIVLLVAAPVFIWHLRQGRRATSEP